MLETVRFQAFVGKENYRILVKAQPCSILLKIRESHKFSHCPAPTTQETPFSFAAVNTTSIVIQGYGHCYDLLSIV